VSSRAKRGRRWRLNEVEGTAFSKHIRRPTQKQAFDSAPADLQKQQIGKHSGAPLRMTLSTLVSEK